MFLVQSHLPGEQFPEWPSERAENCAKDFLQMFARSIFLTGGSSVDASDGYATIFRLLFL